MAEKVHTYVLDTSVLLSDPGALLRFAEHHVVIPLIVVSELEGKRNHPELGFTARKALHILDDFRSDPVARDHGDATNAPNPITATISGSRMMMRIAPRTSNENPDRIIVVIGTAPEP